MKRKIKYLKSIKSPPGQTYDVGNQEISSTIKLPNK